MESAAEVLVTVDDLDETSNYSMDTRLCALIVETRFKWQAKRIERALCAEIQDLVKDLRLLVNRHEVQADTDRTDKKRQFKVSLSFTVDKIDAERARRLCECLETFLEGVEQRTSGEFCFGFQPLEDPRGFSFAQRRPRDGIDTLLLATRIIQEDTAVEPVRTP